MGRLKTEIYFAAASWILLVCRSPWRHRLAMAAPAGAGQVQFAALIRC